MRQVSCAALIGLTLVYSFARAGVIERGDGPVMYKPDSTGGIAHRSTSWTLFGGKHRGVRWQRWSECPLDYKWLVGISINPAIGGRWRLPIDLSAWEGWGRPTFRANVSIEYEVLEAGRIKLYAAVGAGIFVVYAFPLVFDVGGGGEYRLSQVIGLRLGARTLLHYNPHQRPSPRLFSSPVIFTFGVNLYST